MIITHNVLRSPFHSSGKACKREKDRETERQRDKETEVETGRDTKRVDIIMKAFFYERKKKYL